VTLLTRLRKDAGINTPAVEVNSASSTRVPEHMRMSLNEILNSSHTNLDIGHDPIEATPEVHVVYGLLLASLCSGSVAGYYLCLVAKSHANSLLAACLWSVAYVTIITLISAIPVWVGLSSGQQYLSYKIRFVLESVGLWLALPPTVLLFRLHSHWAAAGLVVISVILAKLHTDIVSRNSVLDHELLQSEVVSTNDSIRVLEPASANWLAIVLSLNAQFALAAALGGYLVLSTLLVCLFLFTLVRVLLSRSIVRQRRSNGGRHLFKIALYAIFSTISVLLLLVPQFSRGWLASALKHTILANDKALAHKHPNDVTESPSGSAYESIILWPPKKMHPTLKMPSNSSTSSHSVVRKTGLLIPFDGPYWFYKAPETQPNSRARVVHGNPTKVDIHSTDRVPLKMEARQPLGSPLPIVCCSHLQVSLVNADSRAGQIDVTVTLSDSTKFRSNSISLGTKTIVSSTGHIDLMRPPVNEILDFSIPHSSANFNFDTIRLFFTPEKSRALGAVKISIQTLRFIP
jgi:hypothetical protein